MKKFFVFLFILFPIAFAQADTLEKIKERGVLLWGADQEGGAPYIFPDVNNPKRLLGFEVELAQAMAKELGVQDRHVQDNWDSLIPALNKGDFDLTLDGIEITPQRRGEVLFSKPFYVYTEQIVVRKEETNIEKFEDLKGKKVGTLSASAALTMLQELGGVQIKVYSDQAAPYIDLGLGRLDAVLLDLPIAIYYAKPNPQLKFVGDPIGEGFYGVVMRKGDQSLKKEVDAIIEKFLKNGTLQRIYKKWDLWNPAQKKLFENNEDALLLEGSKRASALQLFPTLLKGAGITVLLSCSAMALAIVIGLLLTLFRLYGPRPLRYFASAYVEIYRGTPLLIQLYILYYGLPNIGINLNPIIAAILGLGMNYAAYEAEIYRAGIQAVPKGQSEAAQALGMRRRLTIGRIILPQAIRITLPAVTNDFIALFKDSSIVSMITMVELTKTYTILATTTLQYLKLGLMTAFLYFVMSYPLSLLSQKLELKMKRGAA